MRRGLQRAGGFALFIAVCNSPAATRELIRLLQESMPGVKIETVTLDESIEHPLDAVLAQVDRSANGPVMIVGLERSNPSSVEERPILYALNMSRPEWSKALPRPLVFWVPEYLLGLMGREAPDFLDWRSDTLFFPESLNKGFLPLETAIWLGKLGRSLPEPQRRARMDELVARLAIQDDSEDPVISAARSDWLMELGNHLAYLDELQAARENFLAALEIEQKLGRDKAIADLSANLGLLQLSMGQMEEAEGSFKVALPRHQALRDRWGETADLVNLASLCLHAMRLEEAEGYGREALLLAEQHDIREFLPVLYNLLLGVALEREDRQEANRFAELALSAMQEAGSLQRMEELFHNLGVLAVMEGDLDRAEQLFLEARTLAGGLGRRLDVAESLVNLGVVYSKRGQIDRALESFGAAREIFALLGDASRLAEVEARLRELDAPLSPARP